MHLHDFIDLCRNCKQDHKNDDSFNEVKDLYELCQRTKTSENDINELRLFSLIAHIYSAYRKLIN